ncbi:MAG: hypothetical protein PGN07_06250 [Aeromicrobium erythreum]
MLTEEHYAAIGRVAIAATALESSLCMLHVLLDGNKANVTQLMTRPSVAREKLAKTAKSTGSVDLAQWLQECEVSLERRHQLIHSTWGVVGSSRGGITRGMPIGSRAKKDRRPDGTTEYYLELVPANAAQWRQLETELARLDARARPFIRRAAAGAGLIDADSMRTEESE